MAVHRLAQRWPQRPARCRTRRSKWSHPGSPHRWVSSRRRTAPAGCSLIEQTGPHPRSSRDGAIAEANPLPRPVATRLVKLMARVRRARGLLGLAFDPDFAAQRPSSSCTTAHRCEPVLPPRQDHTDTLSEFQRQHRRTQIAPISASGGCGPPIRAAAGRTTAAALWGSGRRVLYLGDRGWGREGDASEGHSRPGNAQDLDQAQRQGPPADRRGTGEEPYAIPGRQRLSRRAGGGPEIYAYGFRNPWRLSWEPGGPSGASS